MVVITVPLVATYIYTLYQASRSLNNVNKRKEPPTVPYAIPLLGNAVAFVRDTAAFTARVRKRYGHTPVRLDLVVQDMYLVAGTENILDCWKSPRSLISKSAVIAMDKLFGTPKHLIPFYEADDSGINHRPDLWSSVRLEDRIHYLTHKTSADFLAGPGLKTLGNRFMEILGQRIAEIGTGYEWQTRPCLYAFVQKEVFSAVVEAMCGSYLIYLNEDFPQNFFVFDRGVRHMLKGFPRWTMPKEYRARDRCLECIKEWHAYADQHFDPKSPRDDEFWEPYFGTEFIKARKDYLAKMKVIDANARASEDLGMIWALNANSIPATFWFLVFTISTPNLFPTVFEETRSALQPASILENPRFDISKLTSSSLLQSIYAETLRLRVANFIVRCAHPKDFYLRDKWIIPKGGLISISSYTAHMDNETWNTGTKSQPHLVEDFWPERFIINPKDPTSGPLKVSPLLSTPQATPSDSDGKISESRTDPPLNETPRFSLDNTAGTWLPFGGGNRMCPGRHFAKQEILISFAMLLQSFEIELLGNIPEPDMSGFGMGTLPPKGEVPFRIKRRERD